MDLIYLTVVSGLLTVAYGIVLTVVSGEDIELTLKFLYIWGPLAAVSVALNVRGARKINRLLEEFRRQRIENKNHS